MELNEYTYITGKHNGKNVSGYILFDENNIPFITGEKCKLSEMTDIRISEAENSNIDDIVSNDFNKLDKKKILKMKDKEAEKVGAAREKELKKAGVKMQDGDYKNRFIATQKAVAATGVLANELGSSKVLVKYSKNESLDNTNNNSKLLEDNLSEDEHIYGDTIPATVKTSLTGKEVPINTDIANDDNWSHYIASNQQAADTVNYTDETLNNIDDTLKNNNLDNYDDIYYSDLDIDDPLLSSNNDNNPNDQSYNDSDDTYSITAEDEVDPVEYAINSDNDSNQDDIDSYDYPDEDIHIDIKNPNDVPITINVGNNELLKQVEKENKVSEEIENELDNYSDDNGFSENGFIEHIINKYKLNKKIFNEAKDLSEKLNIAIKEISKNK